MALRLRRGTDAERQSITPLEGELIYTTDTKELYVGDGSTLGGVLVSASLSDDLSPSLSANLSLNGHDIVGNGNININGTITATGTVNLGDGVEDNVIVGGQIGSSLIPGINDEYSLGDNLARWLKVHAVNGEFGGTVTVGDLITDGNIVRSDSTLIYDGATGVITVAGVNAASIDGDLTGSVFSDDSTPLIDAIGKSGNLPGGLTIGGVSFNHLGVWKSTEVGSDPQVLSDQPNTLIVRGISAGSYGGQLPTLVIDAQDGGLESPTNTSPGDFLSQFRFRGFYDGEYKVASTQVAQWAADADLTQVSPKTNLYTFISAGTGNGLGGYHVLALRGDGVAEGMLFKAPSFPTAGLPFSGSEEEGMIVFDSTTKEFKGWNGTSWAVLG